MGNERNQGDLLHGQLHDPRDKFVAPYTQQELSVEVADTRIGEAATEVTPTDRQSSMVKVYDYAAIAEQLNALVLSWPDTTSFYLPDELLTLSVVFNTNNGDGEKISDAGLAYSSGTSGGLNFSPSATAQASASAAPELLYTIRQRPAQNVPSMHYVFYVENDTITIDDIIAKMDTLGLTVMAWPRFRPEELVFVLRGQQISVQQSASSSHSDTWSSSNLSYAIVPDPSTMGSRSDGNSRETGLSIRTVRIPATLHNAIELDPTSVTVSASVNVTANLPEITGTGSAPSFAAVDNSPAPITVSATASVSPTTISATEPVVIPITGLYIKSVNAQPYSYGFNSVHVEIVDFSNV